MLMEKNMENMFEQSDILNLPVEAMIYDTEKESFPVTNHWHYYMEMIFILRGRVAYVAGDRSGTAGEGELIIFYSKTVHSIDRADKGENPAYILMKFDVNRLRITSDYSPRLSEVFRRADADPEIPIVLDAGECERINIRGMMMNCVHELEEHRYCYGTVLDAILYLMLTCIVRLWLDKGFHVEQTDGVSGAESIYTITDYIDAHSSEHIMVSELAEMCGMSYSHFARSFKAIYRQNCKQFINVMRVNKAADFLLFTDRDLNFISQETGFSDCSHFIRVFKEIKGVTPKKYRDGARR